jgi:hypothetical protein
VNTPILIELDDLIEVRNDLDELIKKFEKINKISIDKIEKARKLGIPEKKMNQFLDILFEENNL